MMFVYTDPVKTYGGCELKFIQVVVVGDVRGNGIEQRWVDVDPDGPMIGRQSPQQGRVWHEVEPLGHVGQAAEPRTDLDGRSWWLTPGGVRYVPPRSTR